MSDDPPPEATMVVVGTAQSWFAPDLATLGFAVQSTKPTSRAARDDVNRRVPAILASLVELGLPRDDLQTAYVSLALVDLPPLTKGGPRRVHFRAWDRLTVRTRRLDLLANAVDRATALGVDEVAGPTLSLEDQTEAAQEGRRTALLDARRQADEAAATLGQRVVGVQTVDLTDGRSEHYRETMAHGMLMSEDWEPGLPTTIVTGRLSVTTTVRVTFLIGPV